jgi:hypothetical protein
MLPHQPRVALERRHGIGACAPVQPRLFTTAKGRGGRRPGLAVTRPTVGAQLRAQRDQRREVGHRLDRPGLRDADEPVRVEVVAEQERSVGVVGVEQPRAPVVEQVALVDRLEPERVALLAERREDRAVLPLFRRAQGLGPELALARGLVRDRLPDVEGYSQRARSFVQ